MNTLRKLFYNVVFGVLHRHDYTTTTCWWIKFLGKMVSGSVVSVQKHSRKQLSQTLGIEGVVLPSPLQLRVVLFCAFLYMRVKFTRVCVSFALSFIWPSEAADCVYELLLLFMGQFSAINVIAYLRVACVAMSHRNVQNRRQRF